MVGDDSAMILGVLATRVLSSIVYQATGKLHGMEWIDKLDGAGYSRGSALTGRLLPAAREASHLFSFSASNYLLSAWYQRDTGKYERRLCDPVEVFTLSPIL